MVEEIAQVVANLENNFERNNHSFGEFVNTKMATLAQKLQAEFARVNKRQKSLQ
jgi:hypothetical protein